jgi:hypothetical protein
MNAAFHAGRNAAFMRQHGRAEDFCPEPVAPKRGETQFTVSFYFVTGL